MAEDRSSKVCAAVIVVSFQKRIRTGRVGMDGVGLRFDHAAGPGSQSMAVDLVSVHLRG